MLSTRTLAKFPEITSDSILEAMTGFDKEYGSTFNKVLKCSPEAYIAIKDYFVEEEHEEMLRKGIADEIRQYKYLKPKKETVNYWGGLFRLPIVLDPELKPGEWRIE